MGKEMCGPSSGQFLDYPRLSERGLSQTGWSSSSPDYFAGNWVMQLALCLFEMDVF